MAITFPKSDIKKAIEGSGGIMSSIATRLHCDWHTAKKKIEEAGLMALVDAEKESLLDMAESMLIKNIQDQDPASIFFYLKTQGKKRGYIERSEQEITKHVIEVKPPTRE